MQMQTRTSREQRDKMTTDDDITGRKHGGNPFSAHAYQTTPKIVRAKQRQMIVEYIARHPKGVTADEFHIATAMVPQTVSARFSELKRDGVIVAIGSRPTVRGKPAAVFVLPPKQGDLFHDPPDRMVPRSDRPGGRTPTPGALVAADPDAVPGEADR